MNLIAQKPCSFGGKKFYVGDEIPAEYVLDPKAQEKMGVLVQVDVQGMPEEMEVPGQGISNIHISIPTNDGRMDLVVSNEALQDFVDVLVSKVGEAEEIIERMTEDDVLILLHATDSRKAIKEAAMARAKALSADESEGEQ